MAPFYPPKSTKILQKSDPKSHQNFDRFLLRFFLDSGSVLGTKLEPCWPPFSSQDAPRTATRRPKTPPRHPKTPQDAPRPPQDAPKAPKTLPRRRFWKDFGEILEDFGKIFGRVFGKILLSNMPPQTYFRKKPASTNSLSKKANQKIGGRRCSPQALAINFC